ncbi:Protein pxr1 [Penicillium capsulatum]|uniref:Protein pxr1 n=1 Tax=Penicillium capsulatum TaxID=69766 RepID=A0A9W9HUF9_9EURO|nr:Protein pxr1 [Penicillium capsulatum]KAJ6106726.1 Protein pxr1 [Penicillium capsulatum]
MSAQGWAPGNRLGARDAAHADMLTAGSHSHIKVTIKDDTLGLGARVGREGEPTGLDAFKGLLGRLNGKSEGELVQEQRQRDDVKLARYAALKFQAVRFVRGGLLAQEKLEALPAPPPTDDSQADSSSESARKSSKSKSKSKSKASKKSCARTDDPESSASASETTIKTKKKKSKKRKADCDEPEASSEKPDAPSTSEDKTAGARERRPVGRQIFRGRHIAQKKKALMDDKSLNEVS